MKKLFCILTTIIMLITMLNVVVSCAPQNMNYYVFDNIAECEKISTLGYANATLTSYDNPSKDKHLKSLTYDGFYAAKYKSDELEFEIFAYEFKSAEFAQAYFKNATGKDDGLSTNFLVSSGMGLSEIFVIDNVRAYSVIVPSAQLEKMKEVLGYIFSVKLNF